MTRGPGDGPLALVRGTLSEPFSLCLVYRVHRSTMKFPANRLFVPLALAAFAPGGAIGQLPTTPPPPAQAAQTGPVSLDAIVAVVGDQPITRIDLRERVLG